MKCILNFSLSKSYEGACNGKKGFWKKKKDFREYKKERKMSLHKIYEPNKHTQPSQSNLILELCVLYNKFVFHIHTPYTHITHSVFHIHTPYTHKIYTLSHNIHKPHRVLTF
uniref:Uncharacterized protein n=1 Tax=Cacopsylla melanoneura TaxID=428564 RepID=A0A8D9EAK0_9HEMI